jgi:hypothetical protein
MIVVWRLTGPIGGLTAVVLLGLNPHYIRLTQRAMSEGILSMWLLAGWLVCAALATTLERGTARRAWQLAVILGITVGLATMTKLTAAPLFFAVAVVGLHRAWRSDWARASRRSVKGWRFPLMVTGVTLAIGYLVFIAQSPRMWRTPIAGPWRMVTWRQSIMKDKQQTFLTEYAITSVAARMETVPARLWHDTGTFAATGISKRIHVTWLDGWTFLGGLVWLLLAERRARIDGDTSRHGDLVVAWAWLAALILPLLLMIPADWDRYYVSGIIATAVVQAVGVGALFRFVVGRLARWRDRRREAEGSQAAVS